MKPTSVPPATNPPGEKESNVKEEEYRRRASDAAKGDWYFFTGCGIGCGVLMLCFALSVAIVNWSCNGAPSR